jgi:hypothetical protein
MGNILATAETTNNTKTKMRMAQAIRVLFIGRILNQKEINASDKTQSKCELFG